MFDFTLKGKKAHSLSEFVELFTSSVICLANIAESAREVERMFNTQHQDIRFLVNLISNLREDSYLLMPKVIPELADDIAYQFDEKQSKWVMKPPKQEHLNPEEVIKRLQGFDLIVKKYLQGDVRFTHLYLERQKKFYQSIIPKDVKIKSDKDQSFEQKIEHKGVVLEQKRERSEPQVELYKKQLLYFLNQISILLGSSAQEATAMAVNKLIAAKELSYELCQDLVLDFFVGRDLTVSSITGPTYKRTLASPHIELIIHSIATSCFNLFAELHKTKELKLPTTQLQRTVATQTETEFYPLSKIRRHSSPAVFLPGIVNSSKKITTELTLKEHQELMRLREVEFPPRQLKM